MLNSLRFCAFSSASLPTCKRIGSSYRTRTTTIVTYPRHIPLMHKPHFMSSSTRNEKTATATPAPLSRLAPNMQTHGQQLSHSHCNSATYDVDISQTYPSDSLFPRAPLRGLKSAKRCICLFLKPLHCSRCRLHGVQEALPCSCTALAFPFPSIPFMHQQLSTTTTFCSPETLASFNES